MQPRPILVHPPVGGVARSLAYQHQQPYTTPNALNVWPQDPFSGRERIGQRHGAAIAWTGVDSSAPNHLGMYRYTDVATQKWVEYMIASQYGSALWDDNGSLSNHSQGTAAGLRIGAIHGCQHRQLYFFADHSYNPEEPSSSLLAWGNDGALSGSGTTFDSASFSDWLTVANEAVLELDCQVVLLNGSNVRVGCYPISAATSSNLTLSVNPMISGSSASSIKFRVERCPKFISLASGNKTDGGKVINQWTTAGSIATDGFVPFGCHLIAGWRDRIIMAGGENPKGWYMCKSGNPFNWNYGADGGSGRAVAGSTEDQKAGIPGDPITALFPYSDETCWMGCTNSIFIFRGDPTMSGGGLDQVSTHVGCLSQYAVCRTSDSEEGGTILWLSQAGLFGISDGGRGNVRQISQDKLPNDLRNLTPQTHRVVLQWDHEQNGVYVFVTKKSGSDGTGHWFFDWGRKAWWPMSFPTALEAHCATVAPYYATNTKTAVVFGCADGRFRQFDSSRGTDQGVSENHNIDSYCDIGPFPIADSTGHYEGIINEIEGAPAAGSGDIDWSIRTGSTPEQAFNASVPTSGHCFGEWNSTGLNLKARPRKRGQSAVIRIKSGEPGGRWAIEHMKMTRMRAGSRKKGA